MAEVEEEDGSLHYAQNRVVARAQRLAAWHTFVDDDFAHEKFASFR